MKVYTTGTLYMASQEGGDADTAQVEAPARLYDPATGELGPALSVGAILARCGPETFWEEVRGSDIPPRLLERLGRVEGRRPGRRPFGREE
jgi:hypothetical protein